jgi:eukaryotic translation initiation factor 2C
LSEELVHILDAFKKLEDGGKPYRPTLSIVICGKRHNARFHPTQASDATQNGNTLPGTVVDKGVTAVYDFDFYLQAHAGLQGTVRPTHYTVIYDENNFDADKIQQGTHVASYLYVRATKAVSLIPAAYYADLACERARCYINSLFVANDKASSTSGGKRDKEAEMKRVLDEAKKLWGTGVHNDLKGTMFYI